ncbi:CDP-alcohol phosphatidyltransferase family protein [Chloroflexota bacterium]
MVKLAEFRRTLAYPLIKPIARFLSHTPITPNIITCSGFLLTLVAASLIITRNLLPAGAIVIVAGLFDMFDGALARHINRVTRFGAILDSTIDRLSEAALFISVLAIHAYDQSFAGVLLASAALIGSMMVSYIRSAAEGKGIECQVGLFTRPERVIVLALGLLLNPLTGNSLFIGLFIIALLSFFTAGQRLFYTWQRTKN